MASAADDQPPKSALQSLLKTTEDVSDCQSHPLHLRQLSSTILYNLQNQHDWTSLKIHTTSTITGKPLPRPLVSGLPPRRVYVHPDEQVEILKAEHESGKTVVQYPEYEWVLPTHIAERWTLEKFSAVFDTIDSVTPSETHTVGNTGDENLVGEKWRGKNRQKRLLLATLHDDSTVVYYIMHDGIVKPRQN